MPLILPGGKKARGSLFPSQAVCHILHSSVLFFSLVLLLFVELEAGEGLLFCRFLWRKENIPSARPGRIIFFLLSKEGKEEGREIKERNMISVYSVGKNEDFSSLDCRGCFSSFFPTHTPRLANKAVPFWLRASYLGSC